MTTDRNDTSKVAVKHDESKSRMELLSAHALLGVSDVLDYGCNKYDAHNWRKGFLWSRLIGAALRHLVAFMSGEDLDPESGLPHIDHLGCCVMFLSEFQKTGAGEDDRYVVVTKKKTMKKTKKKTAKSKKRGA